MTIIIVVIIILLDSCYYYQKWTIKQMDGINGSNFVLLVVVLPILLLTLLNIDVKSFLLSSCSPPSLWYICVLVTPVIVLYLGVVVIVKWMMKWKKIKELNGMNEQIDCLVIYVNVDVNIDVDLVMLVLVLLCLSIVNTVTFYFLLWLIVSEEIIRQLIHDDNLCQKVILVLTWTELGHFPTISQGCQEQMSPNWSYNEPRLEESSLNGQQ